MFAIFNPETGKTIFVDGAETSPPPAPPTVEALTEEMAKLMDSLADHQAAVWRIEGQLHAKNEELRALRRSKVT